MDCIPYRSYLRLFLSVSLLFSGISAVSNDGYILPSSGNASTTQFHLGPELASGTSCGVNALANGASSGSLKAGGGPGFLYAAMNQLAFGANPAEKFLLIGGRSIAPNGGGPGGACGICYKLTPISATGVSLDKQALTFMVIDECPAGNASSRSAHCGMCGAGEVNDFGQEWHFDLAVDAMNKDQYNTFFSNVTDGL
ncbi:hypothetical protein MMC17_007473 [Xylographa soralifera]|nr:hypothetical protein [Xylographa soralifera]